MVRHTRQNEETGRAELIGAGVVGPAASLTAAVIVALGANLVLAPLLGLAMIVGGQPVAGSFAAGAAIAVVGVAFTGVGRAHGAALAHGAGSQRAGDRPRSPSPSSSAASATCSATWTPAAPWPPAPGRAGSRRSAGATSCGRSAASTGGCSACSPRSPASLLAVAGRLAVRRDLGAGVLPERDGARRAPPPRLRGPFGLAWRLQRPAFLGWLVALVGFGLIFGSVSESAQNMGGSAQEMYQRMHGTGQMLDAWFTTLVVMGGVAVAIYAVQVLLRMREEEARGRLEPVLSSAVGRPRWMLSYVARHGARRRRRCCSPSRRRSALTAGQALGDTSGLLLRPERGGARRAAGRPRRRRRWSSRSSPCCRGGRSPRRGCCSGRPSSSARCSTSRLPQWLLDLSPFAHQKAPARRGQRGRRVALLAGVAAALIAAGVAWFRRRDLAPG